MNIIKLVKNNKIWILLLFLCIVLGIVYYNNNKYSKKQILFKKTLEDMDDILVKNNIYYFLLCGTALGYHREKKFIEHDHDIDLGIFENISFQTIINIVNESNKFTFITSYPSNNILTCTEVCFKHNETNIKIDIFKLYKKHKKYMMMAYYGKCSTKPKNRCEWLDPINLINVNFLGRNYNVPNMEYIISHYGNDWNIPKIESYDNQKSIVN